MTTFLALALATVANGGHRISRWTPQLRIIIDTIYSSETQLTADEIYFKAREELPHISLGTVYRNLNKLVAENLISEGEKGGAHFYYKHPFPNTYFECERCKRILFVPYHLSISDISSKVGMKVTRWSLNLSGICKECEE